MSLPDHVESAIEDIYDAMELLNEADGSVWVRRFEVLELTGLNQAAFNSAMAVLVALGEVYRTPIHSRDTRYALAWESDEWASHWEKESVDVRRDQGDQLW